MAKIAMTTLHGREAVTMEAGPWQALLVPGQGANLVGLRNAGRGIDVLRTPAPGEEQEFETRPQVFGLPLLFPPNRIGDGQYTFGGRTYRFPITLPAQNNYHHGILKSQRFTVTRAEADGDIAFVEASFWSNAANDAIFRDFPHEFECRMAFRLSSAGLEHTVTFVNLGGRDMPLGVGYHTPLRVPFRAGGREGDCLLRLSVGRRWEVDERTLPTGRLLPLSDAEMPLRTTGVPPVGVVWDTPFTAEPIEVDGKPYNGAVLTDTSAGVSVFYEVDPQYRHWTLWNNGGGAGWVCAEPQTWAINAPNLDLPDDVTGFRALPAGAIWSAWSKIYIR